MEEERYLNKYWIYIVLFVLLFAGGFSVWYFNIFTSFPGYGPFLRVKPLLALEQSVNQGL